MSGFRPKKTSTGVGHVVVSVMHSRFLNVGHAAAIGRRPSWDRASASCHELTSGLRPQVAGNILRVPPNAVEKAGTLCLHPVEPAEI